MDDADNHDDTKRNIQGFWTKLIQEFKAGLLEWLKNETMATEESDPLEDRELDSLLLKVCLYKITLI